VIRRGPCNTSDCSQTSHDRKRVQVISSLKDSEAARKCEYVGAIAEACFAADDDEKQWQLLGASWPEDEAGAGALPPPLAGAAEGVCGSACDRYLRLFLQKGLLQVASYQLHSNNLHDLTVAVGRLLQLVVARLAATPRLSYATAEALASTGAARVILESLLTLMQKALDSGSGFGGCGVYDLGAVGQWAADADSLIRWTQQVQASAAPAPSAAAAAAVAATTVISGSVAEFLCSDDCAAASAVMRLSDWLGAVTALPAWAAEAVDRLETRVRHLVSHHTSSELEAM